MEEFTKRKKSLNVVKYFGNCLFIIKMETKPQKSNYRLQNVNSEKLLEDILNRNLKEFVTKKEQIYVKNDNELVIYSMFWHDFTKLMNKNKSKQANKLLNVFYENL